MKLAIEVDGLTHDFEEVLLNDETRQHNIEAYGVSFLRFSSRDISTDPDSVVRAIEFKIEELKEDVRTSGQ